MTSSTFQQIQNMSNLANVSADVSENTQHSVDVMTEVQNYLTKFGTKFNPNTEGTHIHNQKNTNLCHSYATISGLRHLLRKFLDEKIRQNKSNKSLLNQMTCQLMKVSSERSFKSARNAMNEKSDCSFNHMLSVFVGCVSPRSFNDLFKERLTRR